MYSWLDKIIAEQAAHYGLSPERFGQVMGSAAMVQEEVEHDPRLEDELMRQNQDHTKETRS